MIFLTLGTQKFQFNRLLKYIDDQIENKKITDTVFAQIGNSTYEPKNYKYQRFLNKEEFEQKILNSNLIITHSGVGTIISAVEKQKPVIVVPRLAQYHEHVDDHQIQIAEAFAKKKLVISNGKNIEDLQTNIELSQNFKFDKYKSSNKKIQTEIINYIEQKEENKKVLMLGSDLSVKGGIVSVIKNYLNYQNWGNFHLKFIATHKEGSKIFKILYFILALIKIDINLLIKKYDIIHIHVSERGSIFRKCMIINHIKIFSRKSKIVLHHHGAEFDSFYNQLSIRKQNQIKKMLKKVDVNIVLSNKLVDTILLKEPTANVEVLYNAVNTHKKNLYNNNGNIILFLGRLGQRKGTYDLLEVVELLKKDLKKRNLKVYLCGDGEVEKVSKQVEDKNLSEVIGHIGWISQEEKKNIFSNTILNILPSYNEGLPMTILETMAYGIPNISTNIASIPEVIKNKKTGFLMEPGDKQDLKKKIIMLLKDEQLRNDISTNSYKLICQNFSLDNNIEKLKKIYNKI